MVATRLRRNIENLKILKKLKKQRRSAFLKTARKDLILCICDCANNVLRGNIRLKTGEKRALKRHKAALRQLAERRKGLEQKRKILVQKGGFLPFLLGPIISAAGGLIGNLLRGRSRD